MKINIALPKYIPYLIILFKTKKYFNLKKMTDVIETESKNYYIFLRKRSIQIKIIDNGKSTIQEIEQYINYLFKNSYIGIDEKHTDIINLKGVRKVAI